LRCGRVGDRRLERLIRGGRHGGRTSRARWRATARAPRARSPP
jgi:hypothetical protein